MKVRGALNPGTFSVEKIPNTYLSLIRLFQNVTPVNADNFHGYEYDEYHVKVETWSGIAQNVEDNYNVFLEQGMANEGVKANQIVKELIDSI